MEGASLYPPRTSPLELVKILTSFHDYCLSHGLTVRPPAAQNPLNAVAITAPISLFPSLFPRVCWKFGRDVQRAYNALYAAIAADYEWLEKVVSELAEVDEFMADLYKVYNQVKTSPGGFAHKFSLGLFRSDYMVHQPIASDMPVLHQVEFNTMAASFGGLASRVSDLHRYMIMAGTYPFGIKQLVLGNVPHNPAIEGLSAGLASAHRHYGSVGTGRYGAILFVVQSEERNVFDQRWLEYELLEKHDIRTYRVSLADVARHIHLDGQSLVYTPPCVEIGEVEITTVYFRAGYGPDDYPTQLEWDARVLLERSRAIKCPTIATQLAGAKKVQQLLAVPGMLERFLGDDAESVEKIRATFTAIYPLDESLEGLKARKRAFEEPEKYVLKPQREGGGNNVYRDNIPAYLKRIGRDRWSGYILMELIEPPPANGVIVRNGEVMAGGVVGELGIYGTCLWREDDGSVVENRESGWLLRTKGKESEEGGVAAGFGCVDGVCLVD